MIEEIRGPDASRSDGAESAGYGGADSGSASLMALSCVIFPFLVTTTMRAAGAIDYADDEARRRYIDTLLTVLVGKSKEENQNG